MARYSQEPGSPTRGDRGGFQFAHLHESLFYDWGGGELLFEQLDDEHWGYRCDEVTRYYALSSYRDGILIAESSDAGGSAYAFNLMCEAVRARKEIVLDAAQRDPLSAGTRAILTRALSDPRCDVPNGWRTHYTGPYVPHYEGVAKPDSSMDRTAIEPASAITKEAGTARNAASSLSAPEPERTQAVETTDAELRTALTSALRQTHERDSVDLGGHRVRCKDGKRASRHEQCRPIDSAIPTFESQSSELEFVNHMFGKRHVLVYFTEHATDCDVEQALCAASGDLVSFGPPRLGTVLFPWVNDENDLNVAIDLMKKKSGVHAVTRDMETHWQ